MFIFGRRIISLLRLPSCLQLLMHLPWPLLHLL